MEFEPLTSYSIAAQRQRAASSSRPHEQQSTALTTMPPGIARQSSDDSADLDRQITLQNNTATNKATAGAPAGTRASLGSIIRRTSYPYVAQAQNVVNHANMNNMLQQIGVNTVEAATVMVNLIKAKEGKRHSLAMVI